VTAPTTAGPSVKRCIAGLLCAAFAWTSAATAHADALRKPAVAAVAAWPTAQGGPLQVGTLTLSPCGPAWCGSVTRALDPSGEVPGTIAIGFEFYPQHDAARPNAGAIVATEGGPGYATTGSRAGYLALFEPLLADRHLLLVDNRGTGRSAPLHCSALQHDPLSLPANVAACGAQLGERAALYGSALAADDLAAVIGALQLGRVDLYGDSYGTFFSQTFAGRHPTLLRSVVLDAAYAVIGADPWYPEAAPQARAAFDAACARSPACAAQGGTSMERIGALLQALRAAPVTGTAPDGDGTLQTATADAQGLAYVMFANASGPVVYRELDAAARAWASGDTAPLLRLVAENQTVADSTAAADRARAFSAGLFTAVSCADYTQIYRMTDPPLARRHAAGAAIAAKQQTDPNVFAPFTIAEFLAMPQDYSVVNLCIPWPVASSAHPPGQPVAPGTAFPGVPVLVLSGDLDSLTPPAQGAQAAALFPNARQVIVKNSFHVTAIGDTDHCASTLVRNFVQTLSPGDVSCAAAVPAYRVLPQFARRAAQLVPANPALGNQGSPDDLRVAAAMLYAAGDAIARWWVNYDGDGVGLRGGRFAYTTLGAVTRFQLDALRWTDDVAVSGTITWNADTSEVRVQLATTAGMLDATWRDRVADSIATITGQLNGRRVAATMTAP
jgi:pimeloyl-ACP methyl ester carboxylesterase